MYLHYEAFSMVRHLRYPTNVKETSTVFDEVVSKYLSLVVLGPFFEWSSLSEAIKSDLPLHKVR